MVGVLLPELCEEKEIVFNSQMITAITLPENPWLISPIQITFSHNLSINGQKGISDLPIKIVAEQLAVLGSESETANLGNFPFHCLILQQIN